MSYKVLKGINFEIFLEIWQQWAVDPLQGSVAESYRFDTDPDTDPYFNNTDPAPDPAIYFLNSLIFDCSKIKFFH